MAERGSKFWRWLNRSVAAHRQIEVVLDRRKGERRRRVEAVREERRHADRRVPESGGLGELNGFLGEGGQFTGDVNFRGALRVDGRLEGSLICGGTLIIGENGRIDAEIRVERLQVRGQVRGNIAARRWVELLETSQVTGTIRTPRLTIWRGAVFNGTCAMPVPLSPSEATAPPSSGYAPSASLTREGLG